MTNTPADHSAPSVGHALRMSAGELLDLVLALESDLRTLLKAVLSKEAVDWERLIPGTIRTRLEEERTNAAQMPWGPHRSPELLDFTTLSDLSGIILNRWRLFQPVFIDKPILTAKMFELRLFRNALAHGAAVADHDKARIFLLVRDIAEKIPSVLRPPGPSSSNSSLPACGPTTTASSQTDVEPSPPLSAAWKPDPVEESYPLLATSPPHVRAGWLREFLANLPLLTSTAGSRTLVSPLRGRELLIKKGGRTIARLHVGQTTLSIQSVTGNRQVARRSEDLDALVVLIRNLSEEPNA